MSDFAQQPEPLTFFAPTIEIVPPDATAPALTWVASGTFVLYFLVPFLQGEFGWI